MALGAPEPLDRTQPGLPMKKEAQSGEHKELQTFAEETLPTLREHLEMAQQVQSEVGG
jgi:predicted outer membrane protein